MGGPDRLCGALAWATLLGFVRGDTFNIYAGEHRIVGV